MTSALSKRQQARNERALQELIKTVPGNDRCADCGARNPGWASWSLGIFLCMRCATLHRKLGTHISKVKSLSMDSWSHDQVESMKRTGNVTSNLLYNPGNVKPNIPIDVDEVEGAMERFLRQKYEHKSLGESRPATRQNTGSTSSVEDRPPPLPPKPGNRFGFGLRASSSTFPSSRSDPVSPPRSPGLQFNSSPPRVNKASRVFGHNIGSASADSFEAKLSALRDMGFPDERRNATVLKGLNGNVEKSVETLIRLGEGARSPSGVQTPASTQSDNVNGLSIGRTRPSTTQSTNPFDRLDMMPSSSSQHLSPLQTQATGVSQASYASAPNSYNPFLPAARPPQSAHPSLEQSFQNMGLGQSQSQPQQLFPNHTGGHGSQSQQQSYNPFLQTFTPPPVPQIPPQYAAPQHNPSVYGQTNGVASPQAQGGNPFLSAAPNNPFNGQTNTPAPFGQPNQQPQQMQQSQPFPSGPQPTFQQPQQSMPTGAAQQPQGYNPNAGQFYQQQAGFSNPPSAYQQYQPAQAPYQPQTQYPVRQDKNSILALYGQPQLAPTPPAAYVSNDGGLPNGQARRSVTMPAAVMSNGPEAGAVQAGSHNPFAQSVGQQGQGAVGGTRHVSQESVDFSGMMGGRQSPDAFAGLSARFGR